MVVGIAAVTVFFFFFLLHRDEDVHRALRVAGFVTPRTHLYVEAVVGFFPEDDFDRKALSDGDHLQVFGTGVAVMAPFVRHKVRQGGERFVVPRTWWSAVPNTLRDRHFRKHHLTEPDIHGERRGRGEEDGRS